MSRFEIQSITPEPSESERRRLLSAVREMLFPEQSQQRSRWLHMHRIRARKR